MSTTTNMIIEFSKSTHNICICLAITAIIIILFLFTPLNNFLLANIFSKIIILALLLFILYYNINQTNKFSQNFNINIFNENKNWNHVKTNIICSYIFSAVMLLLILSIIKKLF
jgi:hypothetical protein